MNKPNIFLIALATLVSGFIASTGSGKGLSTNHPACKSDPEGCYVVMPNQPVNIGSLQALSAGVDSLGVPQANAILLAVEDAISLGGHTLQVSSKDDGCDGDPATSPAIPSAEAFLDEGVLGVLGGSCSGATLLANEILSPIGITMFSASATRTSFTDAGTALDFFLRASNDLLEGKTNASYINGVLNFHNVAVIRDTNSTFSDGAANDFINSFLPLNNSNTITNDIDVKCPSGGNCTQADYSSALDAIDDGSPPNLIYFVPQTTTSAVNFLLERKNFGGLNNVVIFGANSLFDPAVISGAGSAAEGIYVSGPLAIPTDFEAKYLARFGNDPAPGNVPNPYSGIAYDQTNILLEAAESVMVKVGKGKDDNSILLFPRTALYSAMLATAHTGFMGTYNCEESGFNAGDCLNKAGINQVIGGVFQQIFP